MTKKELISRLLNIPSYNPKDLIKHGVLITKDKVPTSEPVVLVSLSTLRDIIAELAKETVNDKS